MPPRKFSWSDRLRYGFDNYMAKGTTALVIGLGGLSLLIIVGAGLVLTLGGKALAPDGSDGLSFVEAAWEALMRTLDAGTMGSDAGWGFRMVMFVVTIGGVFIIATLIGVLTNGVEAKLEELRKGRSIVVERNHTVILGWSSQVFAIVSELVIANENQKSSCIVILGEKDKVEMEDEIRQKVGRTGRTHIVCRTGNPIDLNDLEIVNLPDARAIIILSPDTDRDADSHTIKIILAIMNNPDRRPEPYHIVAEIRNPRNLAVARMVGRNEAQLILTDDLIARIVAQTCRQSGLSVVYTELLDFSGDEIYVKEEPSLAGKTFAEVLFCYKKSAVMGLQYADGRVQLNPPMDTRLKAGDRVIAISKDDDTIVLSGAGRDGVDQAAVVARQADPFRSERTLILGWNRRAPVIVRELGDYAAPGSAVMVVADVDEAAMASACRFDLPQNQTVTYQSADTTDRRVLDGLNVSGYDHVIVLSDSDRLAPQDADARTLITLLHLRDIANQGSQGFAIVSEMLDTHNRELADITRADDFIVSEKLVSLMMAQIAENKVLVAIFDDLFDPVGVELYLKPAGDYVILGQPVNFYTVLDAACRRREVALGYRLRAQANDPSAGYGVVVNPDKAQMVTFAETDRIIVLAED
ncbi:MAG: CASTOR/POLLUX-related putative ion channel [Chloroflexota bacterium]